MTRILAIAIAALLLSVSSASSVGFLTQMSCASDYYAYCSQFQVGSKELRICMRRAGPKLSKSCLNALIADGEVSKAEVERTRQEILAAKNAAKQPPAAKQKSEEPKPKRTAVAKADSATSSIAPRSQGEKKAAKDSDVSGKAEKFTINEQTLAALKQRRPKFIEEAAADEAPAAREPERTKAAAHQTSSINSDDRRDEIASKGHKKKTVKKAKSDPQTSNKKSKAKLAAKKEKQRSQKRKRLAGE